MSTVGRGRFTRVVNGCTETVGSSECCHCHRSVCSRSVAVRESSGSESSDAPHSAHSGSRVRLLRGQRSAEGVKNEGRVVGVRVKAGARSNTGCTLRRWRRMRAHVDAGWICAAAANATRWMVRTATGVWRVSVGSYFICTVFYVL